MYKKRRLKKIAKRCNLDFVSFYAYAMKIKSMRKAEDFKQLFPRKVTA